MKYRRLLLKGPERHREHLEGSHRKGRAGYRQRASSGTWSICPYQGPWVEYFWDSWTKARLVNSNQKEKEKKKKRSVLVSSTVVLPKGCMRKGIGRQERFSYCQRCWGIHIRNLTLTCDSKGCYLGCAVVNEASVSSRSL